MNTMDDQLQHLHAVQLEILRAIDCVCAEYQIRYSLYAGSLLGAVRHHGFIPWDDDLDICMTREDYNRFLSIWEKTRPEGYLLQNKKNTPSFPQSFSKVRKEHTTFLQDEREKGKYHTGIFVDIFPIDRIPDNRIERMLFSWRCMMYQLLTREYCPPKASGLVQFVSRLILWTVPPRRREYVREKTLSRITKYQNPVFCTVAIETLQTIGMPLPPKLMDSLIPIPFEGYLFPCTAMWKEYLEIKYGDFLKLPPEEERVWKHHPLVIDFDKDYSEIRNERR